MKNLSVGLFQFKHREMKLIARCFLLGIYFVWMCSVANSQDDSKQGLARPDWQLRADLEFRIACQSAIQKLCLDLVQTCNQNPSDPANSKIMSDMESLLRVTDGKLPTSLPQHPATVDYVKARKAAVIEWNKLYKAKGRDLPGTALDAEKKFQEAFREPGMAALPELKSSVESKPQTNNIDSDDAEVSSRSSVSATDDETKPTDRKSEKKLSDATVKNAVSLIREIHKLQSSTPKGETTAEKQASSLVSRKAAFGLIEKQPDFFFTFPILDVASRDNGLEFKVDKPVEFEQIQKELGQDLLITSEIQVIHANLPSIVKKWKSIKPGDLLKIRLKIGVDRLTVDRDDKHKIEFSVASSQRIDRMNSEPRIIFMEKNIIDIQVSKQSAKSGVP